MTNSVTLSVKKTKAFYKIALYIIIGLEISLLTPNNFKLSF
jgi:hypothetical protein